MEYHQSPFPSGWFTPGPEVLWAMRGTYAFVPHELLPPLPQALLDGSFSWLPPLPVKGTGLHWETTPSGTATGVEALPTLLAEADSLDLIIPPALVRFVSDPDLHDRVWSCTDCYLDLSHRLIEDPAERGGRMLRFMNDSQACVLWYAYLAPNGDHCTFAFEGDSVLPLAPAPRLLMLSVEFAGPVTLRLLDTKELTQVDSLKYPGIELDGATDLVSPDGKSLAFIGTGIFDPPRLFVLANPFDGG